MIQWKRKKKQCISETKRPLREHFKEPGQGTNNPLPANATAAVLPTLINLATRSQTWNLFHWNYYTTHSEHVTP